jgi:hypothetical protein
MYEPIEVSKIIEFCQKVQAKSDIPNPTISLTQIKGALCPNRSHQTFVCEDEDSECYCE